MRCSHFSILAVLLLTATIAFAQNLTVQVSPLINPTEIPPEGGSFSYQVSITNYEYTPQQCTLWGHVITPSGVPMLALGPLTLNIAGGVTHQQTFSYTLPAIAQLGNYLLTASIGIYPSTIWDSDQFAFYKLKPPEWVARYNGLGNFYDEASAIVVDSDGYIYVTGKSAQNSTEPYNLDYATIKYDTNGTQLWVSRFNGPEDIDDRATALAVAGDGNVYVTGICGVDWISGNYATIKYDAYGNQLWVAYYDGPGNREDWAHSVAVDSIGNVFVTGTSYGGLGVYDDYATIKYDANGNQIWLARYDGPGHRYDTASSLALDSFGNIFVTGSSWGEGTDHDYTTIKYDTSGSQIWVARYDWSGGDAANSLVLDRFDEVYISGTSSGGYATIKYDTNGNQLWAARYTGPGSGSDYSKAIALDSIGNVYVTGPSWGNATAYDFATVKYDLNGNQLWVARYNGPGNYDDWATSLAVDSFGNVYVTGDSRHNSTNPYYDDYTTIKYDGNGNQIWLAHYNGPGNGDDAASSLALDSFGNIYVTGYSFGSGTYNDYTTIKYAADGLVGVKSTAFGAPLPTEYRLEQNYPNPFNPTTTISYQLPADSHVKLEVFDVSGRLVTTLIDGWREAGSHEVTFDGSDLASGIYLYRLEASGSGATPTILSGKMVLIK